MKRRKFMETTGTLALTSLIALQCKSKVAADKAGLKNIGIQLYTVRDDMDKDPIATLKTLADIGFTHVESTGYSEGKYYGMTPAKFKSVLDDLGLGILTGHTKTGSWEPEKTHTMTNRWEALCEDAASIGQKYIICGWLHESERESVDDYKKIADLFNKCGEVSKKYGIKTGFHNHDFEFNTIDGVTPYDLLLEKTESDLVCFELDHYWTRKGNVDGGEYMEKYSGRFPLWHIKDMEDSEEQYFTEVGSGVIDWKTIFAQKEESGMELFFIEQDHCKNYKPLKSVEIGHDYLAKLSV